MIYTCMCWRQLTRFTSLAPVFRIERPIVMRMADADVRNVFGAFAHFVLSTARAYYAQHDWIPEKLSDQRDG